MKMQMSLKKSFVARSGHSWNFAPGITVDIPQRFVLEAMQQGAFAVETDSDAGKEAMAQIDAEKLKLGERAPQIEAAIKKMVERNQRGDFTAGGRPNLNALFKETGLQVTSEELEPIWNTVRKEIE